MANYSLVVGSKFNPFTYEELAAPLREQTIMHQQLEDQYTDLNARASVWEKLANDERDKDSKAYRQYKNYSKDLRSAADILAREGLNASSRQMLGDIKGRYSSEIIPIEEAYTKREEQTKMQQEALMKNPSLLLSRRAALTDIDAYLNNPNLTFDSYSGNMLTEQAGKAALALSKQMRDDPRKWRSILGNSYYETMMQKGFSSEDVLMAINNNPKAKQELLNIVDDTVKSSRIGEWADLRDAQGNLTKEGEQILQAAREYASRGLWNAVGETQYQVLENWRAKIAAQEEAARRRKQKEAEEEKLRALAKSGFNYLQASGKDQEYLNKLKGLKAGEQGLKSAYFGKYGNVDIMKVYEEAQKAVKNNKTVGTAEGNEMRQRAYNTAVKEADERFNTEGLEGTPALMNIKANRAKYIENRTNILTKHYREEAALNSIKDKYGVSDVISEDTYNTLKEMGYNAGEGRHTSFSEFKDLINSQSKIRTAYSTAMSNYSHPDAILRKHLLSGSGFSGSVYEMSPDGTKGHIVEDVEDMKLGDRELMDVSYSPMHPDKIIVQYGKKDSSNPKDYGTYIISPEMYGSDMADFFKYFVNPKMGETEDKTQASKAVLSGIIDILNNYNPVLSGSSSDV